MGLKVQRNKKRLPGTYGRTPGSLDSPVLRTILQPTTSPNSSAVNRYSSVRFFIFYLLYQSNLSWEFSCEVFKRLKTSKFLQQVIFIEKLLVEQVQILCAARIDAQSLYVCATCLVAHVICEQQALLRMESFCNIPYCAWNLYRWDMDDTNLKIIFKKQLFYSIRNMAQVGLDSIPKNSLYYFKRIFS